MVFYRASDGQVVTASVYDPGRLVQLQAGTIATGYDHVVVAGDAVVFYGYSTGRLLIVHIDLDGHLVVTQDSGAARQWGQVVAVPASDPIDP